MAAAASPSPTLCQVVAMVDCYRKLFIVWATLPSLTILSPFVLSCCVALSNFLTNGQGFVTTLLTFWFVSFVRSLIYTFAPSRDERNEALQKCRWILPVGGFALVRISMYYIIGPILSAFKLRGLLELSPSIPFGAAVHLAGSMTLLGAAVVLRMVGPFSVVRCSSFPLAPHPISSRFRVLLSKCTSLGDLLGLVASPGDAPGVLMKNPFSASLTLGPGRRYQTPLFYSSILQFVLSGVVALFLSYLVRPFLPDYVTLLSLFFSCAFTVLAHLMLSCLDGTSHEIDPRRYQKLDKQKFLSTGRLLKHAQTFTTSIMFVPFFAIVASFYTENALSSQTWKAVGCDMLVASMASLFLSSMDLLSRYVVCYPTLKVSRLVHEISGDFSTRSTLEVVLCSILHGDGQLIKSISSQTRSAGTLLIEEEEVYRNDNTTEQMAQMLLRKETLQSDAYLEQDLLRVAVLESFGGGTVDGKPEASGRQSTIIRNWVSPEKAPWVGGGGSYAEPLVIPLVRALCAYSGGLGAALRQISIPTKTPKQQSQVPWTLPPGAVACSEWATIGAARFIVESITSTGKAMSNWRSSHLSMLVPVALHSAFSLRTGILAFNQMREGFPMPRDTSEFAFITHDLRSVVVACDKASLLILETLKSLEGVRNLDVKVHTDCRIWLEGLMATSLVGTPSRATSPLLLAEDSARPKFP